MGGYICVTLGEQNMLYFLPTRTDFAVFRKENNLGGTAGIFSTNKVKVPRNTISDLSENVADRF